MKSSKLRYASPISDPKLKLPCCQRVSKTLGTVRKIFHQLTQEENKRRESCFTNWERKDAAETRRGEQLQHWDVNLRLKGSRCTIEIAK